MSSAGEPAFRLTCSQPGTAALGQVPCFPPTVPQAFPVVYEGTFAGPLNSNGHRRGSTLKEPVCSLGKVLQNWMRNGALLSPEPEGLGTKTHARLRKVFKG